MSKLLTALLILSFLGGTNAPGVAPRSSAPTHAGIYAIAAPAAVQPSLPGQITAATGSVSAFLDLGGADSWRTHTRTQHTHSALIQPRGPALARIHIALFERSRLRYGHALARALTGQPATFSNPPPHSPS